MRPSAGVRRGRRGLSTDACAALGEAGREEDEERRAEGGGPSGLLAERAGGRRAGREIIQQRPGHPLFFFKNPPPLPAPLLAPIPVPTTRRRRWASRRSPRASASRGPAPAHRHPQGRRASSPLRRQLRLFCPRHGRGLQGHHLPGDRCVQFLVIFERAEAVHMSGISEKAYIRSSNAGQLFDELPVMTLHVCELGIQFGCVRLMPFVHKGLSM
ncbi:uncharacterized protein LOC8078111 [Sorghum bicolor]|uniref:uncharacterized protein LOC8078111 n=1 Tax=Sorghum bicolor TaxID=4558 RepID=UPI000B425EDE|nr:uncharacterized protein LOC8078111 [Sorghum bicolor]|eukprot:XP_021311795.1 uncharacterized protein LOC8078111 [Sorghum bicolor]